MFSLCILLTETIALLPLKPFFRFSSQNYPFFHFTNMKYAIPCPADEIGELIVACSAKPRFAKVLREKKIDRQEWDA